jgi:hypothetical protein
MFIMMGLVSGVYARPTRPIYERYIHAPIGMEYGDDEEEM